RGNAMRLSGPPPSTTRAPPRRTALALSLALLSSAALAQEAAPTPEQIAERLRIVERSLGIAATDGVAPTDLAELDRRLRAVELGLDQRNRQVAAAPPPSPEQKPAPADRKSTRLDSSHVKNT